MIRTDVLIIGGGPAGLGAAIETTNRGLKTLLVEENPIYGGQLIKQTHKFFGSHSHFAGTRGIYIQDELLKEIKKEHFSMLPGHSAVGIYDDGVIGIYDSEKNRFRKVSAKKVIVATGASEKTIPFKNNDLPGIYGAGGVQTLMNVYGVLPGKKILMIGAGNIGLIVSYQLIQAGADVVGIVEALPKAGGYDVHLAKIRRMGVPVFFKHTIVEAFGQDSVEGALIVQIDNKWKHLNGTQMQLECDTICLAVGLTPSSEILMQTGIKMTFSPSLGGYVPVHNEFMQTSSPDYFVAGDAAGIGEATSAIIEGRLAGISASASLGKEKNAEKAYKEHVDYIEKLRDGNTGVKVKKGKYELWNKPWDTSMETFEKKDNTIKIPKGRTKAYVSIECYEDIPCNPCEISCHFKAITVGPNITDLPMLDLDKCTGCMSCLTQCPGLAIFGINKNLAPGRTGITIPYELLPLPEKGDTVWGADRDGKIICSARVEAVRKNKNKTHLITISVENEYAENVRHFYPGASGDVLICRCLDITADEINDAIDRGYTDFEELKRYLRVTTGPCQGRGCRQLIMNMIRAKTGEDVSSHSTGTPRPPESALPFSAFTKGGKK